MIIESSSLAMKADYQSWTRDESSRRLSLPNSRMSSNNSPQTLAASLSSRIQISESARLSLNYETQHAPRLASAQKPDDSALVDNDPVNSLIRSMIEMLTGEAVRTFSAADLPAPPSMPSLTASDVATADSQAVNSRMAFDAYQLHEEHQEMSFSAEGVVRTTDGQEIRFNFSLQMERDYRQETRVSVETGKAKTKDPLVLNFEGTSAQLTDRFILFDLNGDGTRESIPLLAKGSAFLVFDRNRNGKVDNGLELFGPQSNHGFAELAQFDSDTNGWIDEGDALFSSLALWAPDENGNLTIQPLDVEQIGALSVNKLPTPYKLMTEDNRPLGGIRETGIFLTTNGKPGALQEIDLVVG